MHLYVLQLLYIQIFLKIYMLHFRLLLWELTGSEVGEKEGSRRVWLQTCTWTLRLPLGGIGKDPRVGIRTRDAPTMLSAPTYILINNNIIIIIIYYYNNINIIIIIYIF